jgi:hypothetical protein
MHGTYVNDKRLEPGVPFTLVPGDVIKLGERVTQGERMCPPVMTPYCFINPFNTDIYEGTSLTFSRVADSSRKSSYPTSASVQRGYRVPSISEASDIESDIISIASDQEEEETSAHTTPEQLKMKLGTQQSPINLDLGSTSPSYVIDLDGADSGATRAKPTSAQIIAAEECGEPLSEAEDQEELDSAADEGAIAAYNEHAQSEFDEVDEDEELDFDYGNGFGDEFSDSGSDQQSVDEGPEREASLELGTSFDVNEPIVNLNVGFADHAAIEPLPAGLVSKSRYDPVRSLQSPIEPNNEPVKAMTYTYGFQGYDHIALPATDFDYSSRFDIGPTGLYEPQAQAVQPVRKIGNIMPPWVRDQMAQQTATTEEFQSVPSFNYQQSTSYPFGAYQSSTTPDPTIKNRMSIGGIVDNVESAVPQATQSATVSKPPTFVSNPNKRKADEMTVEDQSPIEPPAKKHTQAPVTAMRARVTSSTRRPQVPKRRIIKDAAIAAGKIMACTAATTFLLGSPVLTQYLQWAV